MEFLHDPGGRYVYYIMQCIYILRKIFLEVYVQYFEGTKTILFFSLLHWHVVHARFWFALVVKIYAQLNLGHVHNTHIITRFVIYDFLPICCHPEDTVVVLLINKKKTY